MTPQVDRRRLVVGAAWTVPAVVVGTAGPALAASVAGCPELVLVQPIDFFPSRTSSTVRLSFAGVVGTPTLRILSVSGVSFTGPLGDIRLTASTTDVVFTRSTSSVAAGTVTVTYQLLNAAGASCGPAASFTFDYSALIN